MSGFQPLCDHLFHLGGIGVLPRSPLGVDQFAVDRHLEATTVRWDNDELTDIKLEVLEKFSRQTDGAIGIASDRTIFN